MNSLHYFPLCLVKIINYRLARLNFLNAIVVHKLIAKMSNSSQDNAEPADTVSIHPLTQQPTKAWEIIKLKQTVQPVVPLDPTTPISTDKIRFVCLSDTHSTIENLRSFVPPGDVLLHAGDFTELGFPKEINEFNYFLGKLPHKVKVVIAGNHDLTLDDDLVTHKRQELNMRFDVKTKIFEDYLEKLKVKSSRELLTNCIYLLDSHIHVCGIKIYGSPWQPEFGGWAFNLPRGAACLDKWNKIPEDTDILMTHGPPIGYGDLCFSKQRAGCVELLNIIQTRVKPKYHLFGHIHEAYGMTTDGQTVFINGSNCTLRYKPDNRPIIFDFPIPEGHSKTELLDLPVNNLGPV
jgi:predicted phosphohydrolase